MTSHWMSRAVRAAAVCAAAALGTIGLAGPGSARAGGDKEEAAPRAWEASRGPVRGGSPGASPVEPGRLAGLHVLIVEPEPATAGFMERALAGHGCTVLGPTRSSAGALAWVLAAAPAVAVLGANGAGRWTAAPVAAALAARGVPFVVVTGRARPRHPALRAAPRLTRPFRPEELARAVAAAVGARQGA
jgi:CheY-like chemotaxis protein